MILTTTTRVASAVLFPKKLKKQARQRTFFSHVENVFSKLYMTTTSTTTTTQKAHNVAGGKHRRHRHQFKIRGPFSHLKSSIIQGGFRAQKRTKRRKGRRTAKEPAEVAATNPHGTIGQNASSGFGLGIGFGIGNVVGREFADGLGDFFDF